MSSMGMNNRGDDSVNSQRIYRLLKNVHEKNPLVHIIMNTVAAQNAANAVLQVGGSPVMADSEAEVAEITARADALVLNTGMLNPQKLQAMLIAAKTANELDIPVLLDPVGVGASKFRRHSVQHLLENVQVNIIRGNGSEIAWAAGRADEMRGVDTDESIVDRAALVIECARKWGVVAALTGEMDLISDGEQIWTIANGHPFMAKISGFGCMASAVIGTFAAVATHQCDAVLAALTCFGVAGDLAGKQSVGPGSFSASFLDFLYNLSLMQLECSAKIDQVR